MFTLLIDNGQLTIQVKSQLPIVSFYVSLNFQLSILNCQLNYSSSLANLSATLAFSASSSSFFVRSFFTAAFALRSLLGASPSPAASVSIFSALRSCRAFVHCFADSAQDNFYRFCSVIVSRNHVVDVVRIRVSINHTEYRNTQSG